MRVVCVETLDIYALASERILLAGYMKKCVFIVGNHE